MVTQQYVITEEFSKVAGLRQHRLERMRCTLPFIDGFQSRQTAMLVHKTIANYGSCFA